MARGEVKDAGEGEAKRILLRKLPPFILNWITDEVERKMKNQPTLRMNVPGDFGAEEVASSIQIMTGKRPTKVSKIHGKEYEIVLPDISIYEEIKKFHGKEFEGTNVLVRVQEIEPNLTSSDIFNLVKTKLTLRNKQDALQSTSRSTNFLGNRRARSVSVENRGKKQPESRKGSPRVSPSSRAVTPTPTESKTPTCEAKKSDQPKSNVGETNKTGVDSGALVAENKNLSEGRMPRLGGGQWNPTSPRYNGTPTNPVWPNQKGGGNPYPSYKGGAQGKGGNYAQWGGGYQQSSKGKDGKGKGKGKGGQNFGGKGGRGGSYWEPKVAPPVRL
jgi:hypothetical protein